MRYDWSRTGLDEHACVQLEQQQVTPWQYQTWKRVGITDLALIARAQRSIGSERADRIPTVLLPQMEALIALAERHDGERVLGLARAGVALSDIPTIIAAGRIDGEAIATAGRVGVSDMALIARLVDAGVIHVSESGYSPYARYGSTTGYADPTVYLALGFDDPESWIALAAAGIVPAVANAYVDAGVRDTSVMRRLHDGGVHPLGYRTFISAGLHDLDEMIRWSEVGVDPDAFDAMRNLCQFCDDDIVAATELELEDSEIRDFYMAGVRTLAEMRRWRDAEVSAGQAFEWRWFGIDDPLEVRALMANGVYVSYLSQARVRGLYDLAVIQRICHMGMNIGFALDQRDLIGYGDVLDADLVTRLEAAVPALQARVRSNGRMVTVTVNGYHLDSADDSDLDAAEAAFAAIGGASRLTALRDAWRDALVDSYERVGDIPKGLRDALAPARLALVGAVWVGVGEFA